MKTRVIVLLLVGITLAAPASASAHARSATVALDYRLKLDRTTRSIPGVSVAIFDGDRSLRVSVRGVTVVLHGDLGEPMLRIGPRGAWVNRASVTAVAERLTQPSQGWARVTSGPSYTWHEHRLAPPPYGSRIGAVARFTIPATVDGRAVRIGGTFVRYQRPALWPWVGVGVLFAGAVAVAVRLRRGLALGLGTLAGLAALVSLIAFSAADAPNGRVAWLQIGLGIGLGLVVVGVLVRAHEPRRSQLAGLLGAVAAALSLGSLGVFRHGVVVSLLSATASRTLLAVALFAGCAAAVASFVQGERT
ncbi:MAG TPA: hypothetical protein VH210_09170 [Gaiellaceae bacterium]|jgi:hypothetical protein|nr:hypothetical protein [Gaiellaceae bacterium]